MEERPDPFVVACVLLAVVVVMLWFSPLSPPSPPLSLVHPFPQITSTKSSVPTPFTKDAICWARPSPGLALANDKLKFAAVKKLGLSAMVPPAKATTEFVLNCVIWPWPPTLTV